MSYKFNFIKYFLYFIVFFMIGFLFFLLVSEEISIFIFAEEVREVSNNFLDEERFVGFYKPGYDRHFYPNYSVYTITYEYTGLNFIKIQMLVENIYYRFFFFLYIIKSKFLVYFWQENAVNLSYQDFLIYSGRKDLLHLNTIDLTKKRIYSFSIYKPLVNPYDYNLLKEKGFFKKQIPQQYSSQEGSPFGDLIFLDWRKDNLYYLVGLVLDKVNLIINFIFYLIVFILIYSLLFLYGLVYVYQRKLHSIVSWLDIYVSEDDDFTKGYYEIMEMHGYYSKYSDYYNISKYEHLLMSNLLLSDKVVLGWVKNVELTSDKEVSQFFQLNSNIWLVLSSRVDIISWMSEEGGEGNNWLFFPYELIPGIFSEWDMYLKNYESNQLDEFDVGYSIFDYNLLDLMGVSKYEVYKHPLEDFTLRESTREHLYSSFYFNPSKYFSETNYDEKILERFVERYISIHNKSSKTNIEIESNVEYFGVMNTREEIFSRSTDSGLNSYFLDFRIFEAYLGVYEVPFRPTTIPDDIFESLMKYKEFRRLMDKFPGSDAYPKDRKFKMVPRLWKQMDFVNFMSSIVQVSLAQFMIRSNFFWRDIDLSELEEGEGQNILEERHELLDILGDQNPIGNFLSKFENNIPAMYGYGLGRKLVDERGVFLGTTVVFEEIMSEKKREYSFCKYPPYASSFGLEFFPIEYRIMKGHDLFFSNYLKLKSKIKYTENSDLNFFKNASFNESINLTYYVGIDLLPEGYSFVTGLESNENMYDNLNIKLESSGYMFEERDVAGEIEYEVIEDGVEVMFFGFLLPAGLFINFFLYLLY